METEEAKRVNYEDFFKEAIIRLRDTSKSRGIHSVYSGFNQAFRKYYGEDPVKVTQMLAAEGKIGIRPVKGGVMIYLPGEGPALRRDLGEEALSKILGKPKGMEQTWYEQGIGLVAPEGVKRFPQDFLDMSIDNKEINVINVAGTLLQFAPGSNTLIVSPRKHFRYEAKNPAEAKYILYAHTIGETVIKIPKNNQVVFRAVVNYEKYCQMLAEQCFDQFIKHTNDENIAEDLTAEVIRKLGLIILSKE